MFSRWQLLALASVLSLSLVAPGQTADSKKDKKKVVPVTKLDESLDHVDVFEGIEKGVLEVRMVAKDANGGNMFVENKGDKPLNVDFPAAFVGKQVLKQFGGGGGGGGLGGGGGGLGGGGQGGGGQSQGGGLGGGGGGLGGGGGGLGGGGNAGGGGGGFFSVPPDRIVRIAYRSVCLEHGKKEPSPSMQYTIGKLEEFNDDPVLREVVTMVASGRLDQQSAQAATWHVTDKMSWDQLAAKQIPHIGRPPTQYFTTEQILRAQNIHQTAIVVAQERAEREKNAVASAKSGRSTSATVKKD